MSTFKAVILTSKRDKKSDGTTNIKIRITHKRKVAYVPTNIYIRTKDMDNKTGWAKAGVPNENFINLRITNLLKKYRENDIQLGDRQENMSVTAVRAFILGGKTSNQQIDFFEFVENYKTIGKESKGTFDQYDWTCDSLKRFIGPMLPVSEINLNFLFRYEAFLRTGGANNGIINYMKTFRSLFNKCRDHYNDEDINQILIPHYPFRKYKMPERTVNTKQNHLSIKQIKMLMDYKCESERERFARDMFMLMIYLIGIESKDLFHLGKPVNGRVSFDRFKTGRDFSIKLEPEALEIINRYPGEKLLLNASERFKLHTSFYREINDQLKGSKGHKIRGICPKLGFRKKTTTKWARHTWATIARNKCNINKDDVALCLGHQDTNNRVTDIYIDYDYSIPDTANRALIDTLYK